MFYPLIQALEKMAVAPLRRPVLLAWRAPVHTIAEGRVCCRSTATLSNCFGRQSIAPAIPAGCRCLTPFVMVGAMLTIATRCRSSPLISVAATG
ncbi:hypothetical protein KCP71_12285 [Salmonella enterica subsp. enterica]|nr:hypothetical protein KCP71_12285 [Salmonella enterica subsp. enterica]